MADTPQEHEPGTDVETGRQEVDGSLILAGFPSELLWFIWQSGSRRAQG